MNNLILLSVVITYSITNILSAIMITFETVRKTHVGFSYQLFSIFQAQIIEN